MALIKNVAVVGASGNIGSAITSALLDHGFNVTAITRTDSKSTFPPSLKVLKGDYDDSNFLQSSLKGQDAFVITLGVSSGHDTQTKLINAAAAAGVKWILPNEFGSDNSNPNMVDPLPPVKTKAMYLKQVEERGSNWIGFVNGCWYDFSLNMGAFGVDVRKQEAEIYSDTKCCTTTLPHAGRGIAKLLSLPVTSTDSKPSLSDYANKYVYVESFRASARDMVNAVQKANGTTDADWTIVHKNVDEVIKGGQEQLAQGNFMGFRDVLYGLQFKPGAGGDFHHKIINDVIGLEYEDIDEVTKREVDAIRAGKKYTY